MNKEQGIIINFINHLLEQTNSLQEMLEETEENLLDIIDENDEEFDNWNHRFSEIERDYKVFIRSLQLFRNTIESSPEDIDSCPMLKNKIVQKIRDIKKNNDYYIDKLTDLDCEANILIMGELGVLDELDMDYGDEV